MNTLLEAFEQENNPTTTQNGCITNKSSLDAVLDFFFVAGSNRGKDVSELFQKALSENEELAVRALLWLRDIRGGAGERQQFKNLVVKLPVYLAEAVIQRIPEIGRWDDLFVFFDTALESVALDVIALGIKSGNGLCAKWMPRQGAIANKIRKHTGISSPKEYRKTLVGLTSVVEQHMCAKQWDKIDFEKVPSVAAARYQKAFNRNTQEAYSAYLEALKKGEAKINASAVYPYDIIKSVRNGDAEVADAQWKALPNYLEDSTERFLPIVDVSGSMEFRIQGTCISCMDVAVSLGLYIAERNIGAFKDVVMTFHRHPELFRFAGNLQERDNAIRKMPWGMNTDIAKCFDTLLNVAVLHNVPQEQMPTSLIIVSDMEFDRCVDNGRSVSAFDYARKAYEAAGYNLPKIIFWTLNARQRNIPVQATQTGAALFSGFSPAIMKSVLKGGMDPVQVMLDTLMNERYNFSIN